MDISPLKKMNLSPQIVIPTRTRGRPKKLLPLKDVKELKKRDRSKKTNSPKISPPSKKIITEQIELDNIPKV